MALQTNGQISFSDLQTEFDGEHPINMAEYASYRTSGSGSLIKLSDFYGAAADFTWDTSSPRTLNTNTFKQTGFEDAGTGAYVAGRVNIVYGASSAAVTVSNVDNGFATSVETFTINYSNSSVITSLQARWVLVNASTVRSGSTANNVKGLCNGSASFSKAQTDSDYDVTGSYITVTPAVFGGGSNNTQNYEIRCTTEDINEGDAAVRSEITLTSGGSFQLQLLANYSGGSDTFIIQRLFTTTTSPRLEMETDYI